MLFNYSLPSLILALLLVLGADATPLRRAANGTCTTVSTSTLPQTDAPAPSTTGTTTIKTTSTKAPKPTESSKPKDDPPVFPATFHNPIKKGSSADPWIIYDKDADYYYFVNVGGGGLTVRKSKDLTNWNIEAPVVWKNNGKFKEIWAPELHKINGGWYIYVAMVDPKLKKDNKDHRMYVLKGTSKTDPTKPFKFVGKIATSDDNWAIDGTVMQYTPTGKLYFIWSGWNNATNIKTQNLYIAEMSSPTKLNSKRVLLHEPKPKWQRSGKYAINEGPTVLEHKGRWFVVYSSAGSWTDDYNLALMGIDGGKNPMSKKNWWALNDRPVFRKSEVAFGPGHASFTVDRKGTPYIVYHAMAKSGSGWGGRSARIQSFGWNKDGSPSFPRPVGFDKELPHPK